MFKVPDSVTVRRPFTLDGAPVPVGVTLTKQQVLALGQKLNPLLDNGTLVAVPDPNGRRNKPPRPTSLPPVILNAYLRHQCAPLSVSAKALGKSVSVTVSNGVPSFTVVVDEGKPFEQSQSKSSRSFAFTVNGVGTHSVDVTDGAGATASTQFTIVVEGNDVKGDVDE